MKWQRKIIQTTGTSKCFGNLFSAAESRQSNSPRSQAKPMTDEQISKLTITEIRELITRLLEEIELRFIAEQLT